MNLTFFQGFCTGALVATVIIFVIMAICVAKIKTGAEKSRDITKNQGEQSISLMRERNDQERESINQLVRIAESLEFMLRTYQAR